MTSRRSSFWFAAYGSNCQMWSSELWGKFAICNFQYSSSYLNYTVIMWPFHFCFPSELNWRIEAVDPLKPKEKEVLSRRLQQQSNKHRSTFISCKIQFIMRLAVLTLMVLVARGKFISYIWDCVTREMICNVKYYSYPSVIYTWITVDGKQGMDMPLTMAPWIHFKVMMGLLT